MTRITPHQAINSGLRHAQVHLKALERHQREISTGLKLHRASDDPGTMHRVLALKSQDTRFESDLESIHHINTVLNQSVTHLQEVRAVLARAKQIGVDATQPASEDVRGIHVTELNGLIDRLLDITNANDGGRYFFGGTDSGRPPFTRDGDSITYEGGEGRSEVPLGRHRIVSVLYPGSDLFLSKERSGTVILGDTGAAPADGTDSGTGKGNLVVRHTLTQYAIGSGISPGTRSAAEDTIIGAAGAHTLTIVDTSGNGSAGTVSLNGGPEVAFTNADTNLEVVNGTERVFVDTTAIVAGFSGSVDITADGTLSLDGGLTETAIDFSSVQVLTDSTTGRVTGIDSTGIRRTGTDQIDYPGTFNVFDSIIALRDTLLDDSLTQREVHDLAAARVQDFERHSTVILDGVGELATTLESLESLQARTEDLQLETRTALAGLEGADLAEAAVGLQNEQQLLEMTYSSLARVMNLNLFDFLR